MILELLNVNFQWVFFNPNETNMKLGTCFILILLLFFILDTFICLWHKCRWQKAKQSRKTLFIKKICQISNQGITQYTYKTPKQEDKMLSHISTCGLNSNNRTSGDTPIIHLLKLNQSFCKVSIKPFCAHLQSHMCNITPWSKTSAHIPPAFSQMEVFERSELIKTRGPYVLKHCITWECECWECYYHCWSTVPSPAKLFFSSPPSSNHLSKHSQSIQSISSALSRITHLW